MADVAAQTTEQPVLPPDVQNEVKQDVANEPPVQNAAVPQSSAQPPADENWAKFVQNPSNQNDAGWQSFVNSHQPDEYKSSLSDKDRAALEQVEKTAPENAKAMEQVGSAVDTALGAVGDISHFANSVIQGLGNEINNTTVDLVKTITTAPKISPEFENEISDDVKQFRNSKGFDEGTKSFNTLALDILAPSAEAYLKSAVGQQAGSVVQQLEEIFKQPPKDEYGNQLAWSPETATDNVMAVLMADYSAVSILPAAQVQQIAQPIGKKLFPNDPQAQQQFAFGVGQGVVNIIMAMEGMPLVRPAAIDRAESTGVLKSEEAYFNEPLKTKPPQVAEVPAAPAEEVAAAPKPEAPPAAAVPETINDVVRRNEPILFKQYDDITAKQDRLRGWITDLSAKRDTTGEGAETQGKIDALLAKVNGVEDRLTNKQANVLEDLRGTIDDIKSKDTPDMAAVRAQLVDLDKQKRDMSEQVSQAYRDAQEQMPKPEVAAAPEPVKAAPVEEKPIPVTAETGAGSIASKAPETLNLGGESPKQNIDIVADVSKNLIAAGRPAEEAQANGQITAQIYKYFSDAYGGARGTAEDWYQREGAVVAKQGEKTKTLAQRELKQGVKGKYSPASAASKAIIRLMKRADASTFIHESAHHYLDMMVRFADEANAPERLKADMAIVRQWLGKETGGFSGFSERQHESFARGFERYMHEGVAPTKELAGVFAKFKQWMMDIYKTARDIPNQKIEINDNIRNVFDRMLGGAGEREVVIAPELPLNPTLKDNIKNPALKKLFGSVPKAPQSLSEFLSAKGGLKETADLMAMDAHKAHINLKTGRAKPYVRNLIQEGGLTIDGNNGAAMRAWDAGYFPELNRPPTEAEFYDKLREDLTGNKQFSDKDHEELNNYNDALKYNAQVDQISHETGIDLNGKTHDEFWDAVSEHYNDEKRYNEAHDMASDAQAAFDHQENLDREFAESRGDAWEPTKEPDHATLEDLENDRKQELAANDAAKSTANTQEPAIAAGTGGRVEANVRQGGGGIEPSGRAGEAEAEDATANGTADRATAGEASGNAAARADTESSGYTAGERTSANSQPAGESYYLDKGGRFRLDKFNTSHDAMAALKEMVGKNSDFLDARYGMDAYKQGQLIRANKQLLAQLSEEFVKARAIAKGSPEDMLKYLRISEQMQIAGKIRAELQADWAHAGHALNEVTRTEHVEDVAALVKQVTGKTLYQLEEEANLMAQEDTPEKQAQFAQDMRSEKWRRIEDGTLAYFRNNLISNPMTHAAYLTGNYIWAMTCALATKGMAAMIGEVREAMAGHPIERVKFGEVKEAIYGVHTGAINALPVAAAALRSGVPFMRGQVGVLVQTALADMFKSLPEKGFDFSLQEKNLKNAAREEAVQKGVRPSDINPALALMNADKGEALAQKNAYFAIHAYLEDAAAGGTQEYRQSLPGKLGRALTVPERSMAAIHTVSYAMNFEMEIASEAYRYAVAKGLEGDAMNIAIAKFTQNPPIDVMNAAHEQALRAVFMNKPTYGGLQYLVTKAVHNDVPLLRVFTNLAVPFAQIGMNIIEQGFIEHTPLGFLSERVRGAFLGKLDKKTGIRAAVDPAIRDMAASKMIVGSGIGAATMGLAATGFMTGGGPTDYRQRTVLEATGWKPYSVRIGDLYVPYKRWLGPMGPLIGACADLSEAGHLLGEGDLKHAATAVSAGFSENVADETWMNGLSNLVSAFKSLNDASGGKKAWQFIETTATGFVPYSSALNQAAKWTDPTMRAVQNRGADNLWGLLPKIQARIPVASYMLPAKVDVFGEPIASGTGISPSWEKGDPVIQKLADLGAGIAQLHNTIRGVRLSDEQYHDYAVTAGVLVKQNLAWLVQNEDFNKLTHTEQIKEISSQVKSARSAAQQDVLFRYPDLIDKANEIKEMAEKSNP